MLRRLAPPMGGRKSVRLDQQASPLRRDYETQPDHHEAMIYIAMIMDRSRDSPAPATGDSSFRTLTYKSCRFASEMSEPMLLTWR
jgi:hypothetical protein